MTKEERIEKYVEGLDWMQKLNEALFGHKEEQRRRLEHFLAVSKQAKFEKDIIKVKAMLKELKKSDKPLSIQRITELKNLDVMSSPYNQTLVSMLKVEKSQLKQIR